MFKFKKLILAFACLFVFQGASAYEVCGLESDFVPWPWSDAYSNRIIDQNWLLIDRVGVPRSELTISKASMLWGKRYGLYSLQVNSLNGNQIKWGTARGFNVEPSGDLNFNVWTDGLKRFGSQTYKVKIGYWSGDSEILPIQNQSKHTNAINESNECRFFKSNSSLLVGLIVEIETKVGDVIHTETLYGLAKEPIYLNE